MADHLKPQVRRSIQPILNYLKYELPILALVVGHSSSEDASISGLVGGYPPAVESEDYIVSDSKIVGAC